MKRTLNGALDVLRNCGEHLLPYNFPQNHPSLEDIIFPLKITEVEVDGYDVGLHFSKADYGDHYLESLQVSGTNTPFLPFNVVVKVAQIALGSHRLSLIKAPRQGKVFYCWTLCVDKQGHPIPFKHFAKGEVCNYEGFEFNSLTPDSVNFH
jgi:hypothetical protein